MGRSLTISVDGACSGRRAACAAVLSGDGKIVDEADRALPQVDGYVLGAEIAGVALASEFFGDDEAPRAVTVEVDNPDVPHVIEGNFRPRQFARIPTPILEAAMNFWRRHHVRFRVLPRNSTVGLRRAHRLASKRLRDKYS